MENYVGEIRVFAGTFAPEGWSFCNGGLYNISEYDALFNLIGTTYGGDGQTTFAVPNIQSRVVVGQGRGATGTQYTMGMMAGTESVTLSTPQMPVHQHALSGGIGALAGGSGTPDPNGNYFGNGGINEYAGQSSGVTMATDLITGQTTPAGSGQPHANIQPGLALNYIIALNGIYPSQQ